MEDCEDFDVDDANDDDRPARQPAPRPRSSSGGGGQRAPASGGSARGTPISADVAAGLRGLLFGDETARFNHAWLQQEFVFSRYTGKKGGSQSIDPSVLFFVASYSPCLVIRLRALLW